MSKKSNQQNTSDKSENSKWSAVKEFVIKNKKILLVAVVILGVLIKVYFSYLKIPDYELFEVRKDDITQKVIAYGEIESEEEVELNFPVSGKIASLEVEKNDHVEKDQLIASLDTVQLSASLQDALNTRRNTQATVDNIYDQLQGKESTETFAEIATRTTAEVANDNAYDAVLSARNALSNAKLYSPINGVITQVHTHEGVSITTSTTIATIADPEKMVFVAKVSEADIVDVKLGQHAKITLDAHDGEKLSGEVSEIDYDTDNTINGGTKYYLVKITIPNLDKVKLGMGGDVEIDTLSSTNALIVPRAAVQKNDSGQYVEVLVGRSAQKKEITTGLKGDNGTIEILTGLSEKEKVIIPSPN